MLNSISKYKVLPTTEKISPSLILANCEIIKCSVAPKLSHQDLRYLLICFRPSGYI